MQELHVTSWQLFGHDRLYVNLPDGTAIGWADRVSGTITVLHPSYRDAVTDALARQVPDLPALVEAAPSGPPPRIPPPIPPLRRMRKRGSTAMPLRDREPVPEGQVPTPARVPTPAQVPAREQPPAYPAPGPAEAAVPAEPARPDRARVPTQAREPDHPTAEWDLTAEPWPAVEPEHSQEPGPAHEQSGPAHEQSGPAHVPEGPAHVPGPAARRPVLPALTPENDLASRRPGTALRAELAGSGPGELVRAATGALRRHKDADPRRTALSGERRVGAELKRLTRHGWRVLHSVPLPDGADIGHLLIGPGGVFTVATEHRPGASVQLGDGTLRVDDGAPQAYVLEGRPETRRTQRMLEAHCAFAVPVQSVLVFVGVAALDVLATPPGVRVCRERQVSVLAPLTGVLTATQVERVYDVARNREAWLDA